MNFVHGSPLCGVSLGLLHRGRAVLGVIDLPYLNCRYSAVHGDGATVNGQPIQVSSTRRMGDAMIALADYEVGPLAERKLPLELALTRGLASEAQRVRILGSAAVNLAWLAEGRLDGVIMLSNNPWDMAAGVAICREAGATVTDSDGSDHTAAAAVTVASVPGIAPDLLTLLRKATEEAASGRPEIC